MTARQGLIVAVVLAPLLGGLSLLVMLPAAQHLRSLRDGVRAEATLRTPGTCFLGSCRVAFEAGGRTVVADLPVGSGAGRSEAGTPLTVRYRADAPQVVAAEDDVHGGGAALLALLSGGAALLPPALAMWGMFIEARRRRPASASAPVPQTAGQPPVCAARRGSAARPRPGSPRDPPCAASSPSSAAAAPSAAEPSCSRRGAGP
ncbi:hypothetical protein ACF07V_18440 [Streptomyces sp. NPDC015661]|uniref:hypothetical protein n=1 Tax=Streptomyces sp. NPDC015661 TaxID=3364961 RepID=UPI0036F90162